MKRRSIWLCLSALLLSCLLISVSAAEDLKEVRCDEWRFSLRVPEGLNADPVSYESWDTGLVFAGGLSFSPGAQDDLPQVRVIRRSRFFDAGEYLGVSLGESLEQADADDNNTEDIRTYRFGGRVLYGIRGTAYQDGKEIFRELRMIPVTNNCGTEFIARYTAETESAVFGLLDTLIRDYQPDEISGDEKADFLPESRSGEADLLNGTYLLRMEDAGKIETDGYLTASLYLPDVYSAEDVHAMQPGNTILIMDRVMTITSVEPNGTEDDSSWYEAELTAVDKSVTEEYFNFTLEQYGGGYRPYFGDDNHSASCVGQVRVQVPQNTPVPYYTVSEDGDILLTDDLLNMSGNDPALSFIGWNEYNHRCVFETGNLVRVETWDYPHSPEDPLTE